MAKKPETGVTFSTTLSPEQLATAFDGEMSLPEAEIVLDPTTASSRQYVSEDEARAYWAGGRTFEEYAPLMAEYSEIVGDAVRYFLP